MNYAQWKWFRPWYSQLTYKARPLTQTFGRKLNGLQALAGVVMILGFSAAPAYADGWVTMHGTACKPTDPNNSSVTYGNELWTNESAATIICPLVTHWGGGSDVPFAISDVTIFYGHNSGNVECTLYQHQGSWGNRNRRLVGTATGSDFNKSMTFPHFRTPFDPITGPIMTHFGGSPGVALNNYFIACSLPPGTALYNVHYKSIAVPASWLFR